MKISKFKVHSKVQIDLIKGTNEHIWTHIKGTNGFLERRKIYRYLMYIKGTKNTLQNSKYHACSKHSMWWSGGETA